MFDFLKSRFQKVKTALSKTRSALGSRLRALFGNPLTESTYAELEQILYEADLSSTVVANAIESVKRFVRSHPHASMEEMITHLENYAASVLQVPAISCSSSSPQVFLIVGVNGSGKTTTLAKLARHFQQEGKKVLLAAGDTFRAAAMEQLTTWAEKLGIDIVKSRPQSDPAAVVFDALQAAKARSLDIVLIDTAGRLQNKTDLMQELEKIKRVCHKVIPDSPHETLLILDATVGQNGLDQAKTFHQFTPLTGIILTKLDGSAKGGMALAICQELRLPVRWIGVGEGMEDLLPFDAEAYAKALFS